MKIRDSLTLADGRLSRHGALDHRIEAEVLLRHALGQDRAQFFAALGEPLQLDQEERIAHLVERRLAGEPLAYITGHREFYGLDLVVDSEVLIPRQETETLVDKVLEFSSARRPDQHLRIADVGTGSGAVAIAVARNLPLATLYATDISRRSLAVADANRRRHGVSDRVHLCHGDLLEALPASVDVIVSNPPYMRTGEIAHLPEEVRREPRQALDGGADGLGIIGRLLRQAPSHLRPGGCVMVEIAPEQLGPATRMAQEAIGGARVSFARDLLGLPRVVIAELI